MNEMKTPDPAPQALRLVAQDQAVLEGRPAQKHNRPAITID